jgi:uncharacterized protein
MTVIADTSFVYSLLNQRDDNYARSSSFYLTDPDEILLPSVALSEIAYLFARLDKEDGAARALIAIRKGRMRITELTTADYDRVVEILVKYRGSRIDFVDACIMALAERLKLTQILTYDHRDFRLYQPNHIAYFDLLPD